MAYNWMPALGRFERTGDELLFKGGTVSFPDGQTLNSVGIFICNHRFGGGTISANIEFLGKSPAEICELILYWDSATQGFISAGLGTSGALFGVRTYGESTATPAQASTLVAGVGSRDTLEANRVYQLKVTVTGSQLTMSLDGVELKAANLPSPLPSGPAGLWCMGLSDIRISNFKVEQREPKVFVVMQFSAPYDDLYTDVIRPVCAELGLAPVRADETAGPGVIIADIERSISEATAIIAEITPTNPNVYYEVGYAHALKKPTILIAENLTHLPFDVSPFRALFYENTIAGKNRVETGLRNHLQAIQREWAGR